LLAASLEQGVVSARFVVPVEVFRHIIENRVFRTIG